MFTAIRAFVAAAVAASAALAQIPSLTSVQNPASNIAAGLPNGGIAQGSVFVVYGSNLGPTTIVQPGALPLPTSLGGTSVQITVNGATVTAPMVYSLARQVAGVLPSDTPIGSGTLSLTYNGATGSIPIDVVRSNFGISTVNLTGTGPGVVTDGNYRLYTASNSAKPGDTVVLWGTGLGAIQGSDAAVPASSDLGTPVSVYVGGQKAAVVYRGRSAAPGLDQINFQVPAVSGCFVPVYVQTGNTVSNFTTMAVASNGGACSDTTGLSEATVSGLTSKGNVSIGFIELFQITSSGPALGTLPAGLRTVSTGLASFNRFTPQQFAGSGNLSGQPSLGGCLVVPIRDPVTASPTDTASITFAGLNAGASIAVTGPASLSMKSPPGLTGFYSGSALAALPAGSYTISNGAGGPDVPGFLAALTLPTALTWTNQAALVMVARDQPATVTWTGGDANSFAIISGTSASQTNLPAGAAFVCTAPAAAGQFTIPQAVLQSLPATAARLGVLSLTDTLSVGSFSLPVPFTVPGLDFAYTISGSQTSQPVTYR